MKRLIIKFFSWIFEAEILALKKEIEDTKKWNLELKNYLRVVDNVLSNIDVSVDVHEYHKYSKSWAVISLQGQRSDYIKFVDLGDREIHEIGQFLKRYDRSKIDASPRCIEFLRINRIIK